MTVVDESQTSFRFKVTRALLDFCDENGIMSSTTGRGHRWKVGETLEAAQNTHLHAHSMHLTGKYIMQLQSFSYSLSSLSMATRIGRYCSIAWDVRNIGPAHPLDYVTTSPVLYRRVGYFSAAFAGFGAADWEFLDNPQKKPPVIGHDVWIGQDVILAGGITIGTGAVIAAGSVVVKDVAPYEIVGGVPARHIRFRFSERLIGELLASEWWRYAVPQMPALPWGRPEAFVGALSAMVDRGEATPFVGDLGPLRAIVESLN